MAMHFEIYAGRARGKLRKFWEDAAEIQAEHIEMMACAYLKQTDIPPDEVELVQEMRGNALVWYFQRRAAL